MSEAMWLEEAVQTTGAIIDPDPNWVYDASSDQTWCFGWDEVKPI